MTNVQGIPDPDLRCAMSKLNNEQFRFVANAMNIHGVAFSLALERRLTQYPEERAPNELPIALCHAAREVAQ